MRTVLLCIFIITISPIWAQQEVVLDTIDAREVRVKDQLVTEVEEPKIKKPRNPIFIGADLFNPVMSVLTDKKGFSFFAHYNIQKKWHAVVEVGYETNIFNDFQWDVDVNGMFYRLGFNWFISEDPLDRNNGFYTGFRLAGSSYQQDIKSYPIRDTETVDGTTNFITTTGSLGKENLSYYWIESLLGARVSLFNTKHWYADLSTRIQIPLGGKKQNDITPLAIPGFGKDQGLVQLDLLWGISYMF